MSENIKVIVSLTSHTKERLVNVPYFLYHSIFKYNYDYVKVVLTLYKEDVQNIPPKLKEMIDLGLVELIVAEENLRCHLKYFYAMKKYRDLPIITIDDDSIYPKEMIPDFLKNAEKYPNTIIGRSGVLVDSTKSYICNQLINYGLNNLQWSSFYDKKFFNLNVEGYAGIYYPANILKINDSMIAEINDYPRADDIYLFLIELRMNIDRIVPKYDYKKLEVSTKGFDAISTKPDNINMINEKLKNIYKEFKM